MAISYSGALSIGNRLAGIGKGRSLNERDTKTRFTFEVDGRCEIISGGLFAIASINTEIDQHTERYSRFELSNELLKDIATEYSIPDLVVGTEGNQVHMTSKGIHLCVPFSDHWGMFKFPDMQVDYCQIESQSMLAVLSSVPKLMHNDDDSSILASMSMQATDGMLNATATDNRMIASMSIPCKGDLPSLLFPFAVRTLCVWAINEFGHNSPFEIATHGKSIIVKCGEFCAAVRQADSSFPDITKAFRIISNRINKKPSMLNVASIAKVARQVVGMKMDQCLLHFSKPLISASDESEGDFSTAISGDIVFDGVESIAFDPRYLESSMSCLSRLGFTDTPCYYANDRDGVMFHCMREGMEAKIIVAPMVKREVGSEESVKKAKKSKVKS